jgi:hypothetical protein
LRPRFCLLLAIARGVLQQRAQHARPVLVRVRVRARARARVRVRVRVSTPVRSLPLAQCTSTPPPARSAAHLPRVRRTDVMRYHA